ncbi:hypothetical protein DPMN_089497 [Dreissena polymorpha]|uniref:Uncharacterized protein n=1 Tax=Dreissena polymorpha TaxID=45954 RepID=A0A9D4KWJ3_DREPO|nr:hypothetical protein DPMN_089497 [Dreissena polymorpha]
MYSYTRPKEHHNYLVGTEYINCSIHVQNVLLQRTAHQQRVARPTHSHSGKYAYSVINVSKRVSQYQRMLSLDISALTFIQRISLPRKHHIIKVTLFKAK